MRLILKYLAAAAAMVLVLGAIAAPAASTGATLPGAAAYRDLLDYHGMPATPADRGFNIFFDAGAWQGYSLPPVGDADSGFVGPFVHSLGTGEWTGRRFAVLALRSAGSGKNVALAPVAGYAAPGELERRFAAPGLAVSETLFFADSWHALVRIELTSATARNVDLAIEGQVMSLPGSRLARHGDAVAQTFAHAHSVLDTQLHAAGMPADRIALTGDGYRIGLDRPLHLLPGRTVTVYAVQTLVYDRRTEKPPAVDYADAWRANRARWAGYLKAAASSHLSGLPNAIARRVAVKAMITLLGNWRAARGPLHHAGVIPSYSNPDFNGFWAWDSWKHAAALAWFAPALARDQILAMFDYQAADGMVPDCIFLDGTQDNWRNSKPPLATWAVLQVYDATGDKAFLARMYDKLVRYDRWWYAARDHGHGGLAEYGSTDGTVLAAKWESGMDNAARFDHTRMLRNGKGAWSMDQASVDLNAYLYRDQRGLARIAGILGKRGDQARWLKRAAALKKLIQTRMFDRKLGYFFDVKLDGRGFVRVFGPEGWIPLWAGAATAAQARAVEKVMLDPHKFATPMPFPSLARDNPDFAPIKGYWRGPVWLDQAYFGVEALRRYGDDRAADAMARRLVLNATGLAMGQAPFYENYDPLTGQGYQSRNFSWAAASYLLLLHAGRGPAPVSE